MMLPREKHARVRITRTTLGTPKTVNMVAVRKGRETWGVFSLDSGRYFTCTDSQFDTFEWDPEKRPTREGTHMQAVSTPATWIGDVYVAYVDGHPFTRDYLGRWSMVRPYRKAPFAFRGYKTDEWMVNAGATRTKEA